MGKKTRIAVWLLSILTAPALAGAESPPVESPPAEMILVVGAEGTSEYGEQFKAWAERWRSAAEANGVNFTAIGLDSEYPPEAKSESPPDRTSLEEKLSGARSLSSPLWLVMIGHGVYDRRTARFNLQGPDISAEELQSWLQPLKRPLIVINCAAASAPFINRLAGSDRIIITATRSGDEQSFARFGDYLSTSIVDAAADLDKDGQTSLLEAFLAASRRTAEFYSSASRLASEHALLDDNGDGLGTGAEFFQGVRAAQAPKEGASLDGLRSHQVHLAPSVAELELPAEKRLRRDELERQIESLRAEKSKLAEEDYYDRLEILLLELAAIYES